VVERRDLLSGRPVGASERQGGLLSRTAGGQRGSGRPAEQEPGMSGRASGWPAIELRASEPRIQLLIRKIGLGRPHVGISNQHSCVMADGVSNQHACMMASGGSAGGRIGGVMRSASDRDCRSGERVMDDT
jgi:hypothetical protein